MFFFKKYRFDLKIFDLQILLNFFQLKILFDFVLSRKKTECNFHFFFNVDQVRQRNMFVLDL